MSEQLWYTWSDAGFGRAVGFRVRAASTGLMDTESGRVQTLVNLLRYSLPRDTDPYLPPEAAPFCLAFLKAGASQELVLLYKKYTGLDGVRRPGAYSSRLIVDPPPVPLPQPGEHIAFAAREAIQMWRASFWEISEAEFPNGKRDMQPVSVSDLTGSGSPLSAQSMAQVIGAFPYVLSAFLKLSTSSEQKRLYIVAQPDVVAALIWGVTHALPRTLTIMSDLTFSTFEPDLTDKNLPQIVGTCWLPEYTRGNNFTQDLPDAFYQPNNPYGLAINYTVAGKATPLEPPTLETQKLIDFVVKCYQQNTFEQLQEIVTDAEVQHVTELPAFLSLSASSINERLSREQVTSILTALYTKARQVIESAVQLLRQRKIGVPLAEIPHWTRFQMEAKQLKRHNVQSSLLRLMVEDEAWWREEGKESISKLYKLTYSLGETTLNEEVLRNLHHTFMEDVERSREWQKDQVQIGQALQQQGYYGNDTKTLLTSYATRITETVKEAQQQVIEALSPLSIEVTGKLSQAIASNDLSQTTFWTNVLSLTTPAPIGVRVWTSLLQLLAAETVSFTLAYSHWWSKNGQAKVKEARSYADRYPDSPLAPSVSSFAKKAASRLVGELSGNEPSRIEFWTTVLTTSATPLALEPEAWAILVQGLVSLGFNSLYHQWWQHHGKTILATICTFISDPTHRATVLDTAFLSFVQKAQGELQAVVANGNPAMPAFLTVLSFWEEVLGTIAPSTHQPSVWLDLVTHLWTAMYTPAYQQWWKEQGKETLRQIRDLADRSPQQNQELTHSLLQLATRIVDDLHRHIENAAAALMPAVPEPAPQPVQPIPAGVVYNQLVFLLEHLRVSTPTIIPENVSSPWISMVHKLSQQPLGSGRREIYEVYNWELRELFLQTWRQVPALENNQEILGSWLKLRWSELARFLALDMPEAWRSAAIAYTLRVPPDISAELLMSLVNTHASLFESVLQHLTQDAQWRETAIGFFALLVQNGYAGKIRLLDSMMAAVRYQKEPAERLLAVARMESLQEKVDLLENYCQPLLIGLELPPTLLGFIRDYLLQLDVGYLNTPPTQVLLQRLWQRQSQPMLRLPDDLQVYVELWGKIAQFIAQPDAMGDWLQDIRQTLRGIRNLPQLADQTQQKLTEVLIPAVVERVTTEYSLGLAMMSLSEVLIGQGANSGLLLLEKMASIAGEKYKPEYPLVRLLPYIKVILEVGSNLPPSQKGENAFTDQCLRTLLKEVDLKRENWFKGNPLRWPPRLFTAWEHYLERSRHKGVSAALTRFRQALQSKDISYIVANYDPILDSSTALRSDERDLLTLAQEFMQAYNAGNDTALWQVYEKIKKPPYSLYLVPTPEQNNRLYHIQQRFQQAAQAERERQRASTKPVPDEPKAILLATPGHRSSQPLPQPQPNQVGFVATVRGEGITLGWYERTLRLKPLYIAYQISYLTEAIQRLQQDKPSGYKDKMKRRKQELDELQNQQDTFQREPIRLRQTALDDLIDDPLIREEIEKIKAQSSLAQQFDIDSEKQAIFHNLRINQLTKYNELVAANLITDEQAIEIVAIYRRRERFAAYLEETRGKLNSWLKKQRKTANILIYYKRLGFEQPAEGTLDKFWGGIKEVWH